MKQVISEPPGEPAELGGHCVQPFAHFLGVGGVVQHCHHQAQVLSDGGEQGPGSVPQTVLTGLLRPVVFARCYDPWVSPRLRSPLVWRHALTKSRRSGSALSRRQATASWLGVASSTSRYVMPGRG
jgi:hypothetical protein